MPYVRFFNNYLLSVLCWSTYVLILIYQPGRRYPLCGIDVENIQISLLSINKWQQARVSDLWSLPLKTAKHLLLFFTKNVGTLIDNHLQNYNGEKSGGISSLHIVPRFNIFYCSSTFYSFPINYCCLSHIFKDVLLSDLGRKRCQSFLEMSHG